MFRIRDVSGEVEKVFLFPDHKSQYDNLANFLVTHVQNEMKNVYNLSEVTVPLKQHAGSLDQANIFMSEEFEKPNVEENSRKKAMVLI